MNGIEYLNQNNIKWFPVFMKINPLTNKKDLLPYPDGSMPKYNVDFDNEQLVKHRQDTYQSDVIWMDTKEIAHFDIDSPEAHELTKCLMDSHPYFLSVRKGLPHYFAHLKNKIDHKQRISIPNAPDMEILNGQVSYASFDFQVFNADKELKEFNIPLPHQTKKNDNKSFIKTDTIYQLLDIISIDFIDNYQSWLRIGSALYNCDYDMDVFDYLSKKGTKYGGVEKLWNDFGKKDNSNPTGFGTICYYAKESDPSAWEYIKYKLQTELQKSEIDKFLQSGCKISHSTVSKVFYEQYSDKFVYTNGYWYELTPGGIYSKLHEKDSVSIISKDIRNYVQKFILNVIENETDEGNRKQLWNSNSALENNTFKKACVDESKQEFIDRDLLNQLDKNVNLIGFKNGVYDCENDVFRVGTVDDKISMTTGYDYNPNVNQDNQQLLEHLFNEYFKEPETAHYFKKHLGSVLMGGNREEKVYFWVGTGRNGKGTTDTLFRDTLGDYYAQLKSSFFTCADTHSNQANPEIVDLENSRFSMTYEPEGGTKYLTSKFKSLSGGDPLKGRNLYQSESHEFVPTFKPIIQTNHLPQFTDCDFGLLQRIVVIEFPYEFVDTPDLMNPKQKKISIELKDKLKNLKMDFFHFLQKYYKLYKTEGLKEPKEIVSSINSYKSDIDSVKTFMDQAVIKTDNEKERISSADLLYAHNSWTINKLDKNRFAKRLKCLGYELKQMKIDKTNKSGISYYKWNTDFKDELQNECMLLTGDDML